MIPPRHVLRPISAAAAASLVLLALTGCGHSAPTRYLTLAAAPSSGPMAGDGHGLVVRPPRVRWPAALDRLEVMRPAGDVSLQAEEGARWSAAPGDLAAAALTEDLRARLPGLTLAGPGAGVSGLDLEVDVLSLGRVGDGYRLTALVTVSGADRPTRSQLVSLTTPERGADAVAQARAVSRLIGQLSDAIAPTLAASAPGASDLSATPRPRP